MRKQLLATLSVAIPLSFLYAAPDIQQQQGGEGGKVPVCDAGENQTVECSGATTMVMLDGSGSSDPLGDGLSYRWIAECPGASLTNPESVTPTLSLSLLEGCEFTCEVKLIVTNKIGMSMCTTLVTVEDTTPPVIVCPPDTEVESEGSTDPADTGSATASDACGSAEVTGFSDVFIPDTNPENGIEGCIIRTWAATDGCQESNCDQKITIREPPPEGDPHLDIKPGSCPNPVRVGSNGVVPVSLLGDSGFDVSFVNTSTLRLARSDAPGVQISAVRINVADTGTPFEGEGCECHTLTSDGFDDISMKFSKVGLVQAFNLDAEPNRTFVELVLTGMLMDGSSFQATDCIRVNNNGGGR